MNIVDQAVLEWLEGAGMWAARLHEESGDQPTGGEMVVHDGIVTVNNETNVVTYDVPYVVHYSSVGDDSDEQENQRLDGRARRRSVFFTMTYVGETPAQAKHAGQRIRDALAGRRLTVPGHRVWLVKVEESQRVRRDDDAVRPDGSPLFYGVDNYAVSITLNPTGDTP